jgi:hypothetical protein
MDWRNQITLEISLALIPAMRMLFLNDHAVHDHATCHDFMHGL